MFRTKTISAVSNTSVTNLSSQPLQKRASIKKNKTRDVEQFVTLDEAYLIIHLCTNEIVKRGLTEPDIFNPVQIGSGVRYLINCLLRDDRTKFEDELKFQHINNIIASIRMTLRNCSSNIISCKDYEYFIKHEQEWQYDPNLFFSYLPHKNRGILMELFDLFAMTMELSHINRVHPTRILKSMSLYIFNETQTNTYENFQLAYQDWLKYSNALIHLFLIYLKGRSTSTRLPERLNFLLKDYDERRKIWLMNNYMDRNENENEIFFRDYVLPNITIEDLNEITEKNEKNTSINNNTSSNTKRNSKIIFKKRKSISNRIRNSFNESAPKILRSLLALKHKESIKTSAYLITVDDPETAEDKWKEIKNRGLNLLSEDALKLLFIYDNFNSVSLEDKDKKRKIKDDRLSISEPLIDIDNGSYDTKINNNDGESIIWDDYNKENLYESMDDNSNIYSPTSTFGPSLFDDNDDNLNPRMVNHNTTSNEIRERKKGCKTSSSFFCFKCGHSGFAYEDWQMMDKFNNVYKDEQRQDNDEQSTQYEQSIFSRYTVIRGKELPYPLTPLRANRRQIRVARQSSMTFTNMDKVKEIIVQRENVSFSIMQQIINSEIIEDYGVPHSSQQLQNQF
ncbi:hypothetical protein C1645_800679 [Glomus cerebriforme]|uniref:Rho-GAP domain-containing protein n=1 Tax=Glomus cerebriforme TaxID=658196 RepID=A0A397TMW0_9GLOM|nr:hypothetical protein C1645_800679 [Glomus cerebriforme]